MKAKRGSWFGRAGVKGVNVDRSRQWHGMAVANPRLGHILHLLSTRFDEFAVPSDGRYVREAARFDDSGTVWVPPAISDVRPKLIGALAVAALGLGIYRAVEKRRHA